jgi:polysaccharide transporter, PST family
MQRIAPTMSNPASPLISRRSFVSSSVLLSESFLRLGLVAAVSFWIAHALGPTQFGALNYASALVMVFWTIAFLGLDTPVVARLTRSSEQGEIVGSALMLRIAAGAVCAALACAAVWLMRPNDHQSILLVAIVAISIPISAPLTADCWFKARNEALLPALARIATTALVSAAKIACILLGLGVVALAWTVALEALLGAATMVVAYLVATRGDVHKRLHARRRQMWGLLKESWPYALSTAAVAAYMKIDIVLLGMLSTDFETGVYGLCQRISEVLYILPVIVVDVLYPQLVRHFHVDSTTSESATQTFFDLSLATALISTVVAIAAVSWLVPALLGAPYRRTVDLFQVHSWSCVGLAMTHARYKWLAASGLQAFAPWVTLVGLVLAAVLNLALIPSHGAMGAACATVIAYLSSGYLISFLFPALRPAARMQSRALWPWGRLIRELRTRWMNRARR